MAKEELLEFEGEIIECLPGTRFRVKLDNDHILIAGISGKMRKNKIRVLLGDAVHVEVSMYDISNGRITFRYK